MRSLRLLCLLALLGFSACDLDPFGRNHRSISEHYYLERFPENDLFYLLKRQDSSPGGLLEGTVTQIGVKLPYVIAYRVPYSAGDQSGWFILHTGTHDLRGPLEWSELQALPEATGIVAEPPQAFFNGKRRK